MSLGWFAIGASGDITLTNVNVDNGTLFVDKDNDRVGIRTNAPSGVLQIGSPVVQGVNPLNPLSDSGITIMVAKSTTPLVSGSSDLSGTMWINSTAPYAPNRGASVVLGGRANDNQHLTFGRISGVHDNNSNDPSGDLVMETTVGGQIRERFRIKSTGRVGFGIQNPEGGLHLNTDIICTGLRNKGFRRDVANGELITPGSSVKVPHDSYVTALNPSGTQGGWLYRIDGSGLKYIYGSVVEPTTGDCYVVGSFGGTLEFYDPGQSTPRSAPKFTSGVGLMGFVAKFNESGNFQWAARIDTPGINDWGMGITFVGSSVFIAGAFAVGGTFTAFNQGTAGVAFTTTLTNNGGGHTGFIVKYSTAGAVQAVAKIDGTGNVVLTCAQGYSTNTVYIGGYHNTSGNLTAFNSAGVAVSTAPATTGSFEAFACRYDTNLVPQWIVVIHSPGEDLVDYPSRGIDVDNEGNLYVAGYVSGNTTFRNANGTNGATTLTLPVGSSRMGFLAKFSGSGVFDWAVKITSNIFAVARSVSVTPNGLVYVIGDFLGTASFRDNGDSGPVKSTQQSRPNSPLTDTRIGFLARYSITGTHTWSTKIQTSSLGTDKTLRMIACDNDTFDNCYVAFHSVVTNLSVSSSVNVFQRNSPVQAGVLKTTSTLTYHALSGLGGVMGLASFNSDGKVLYVTKVDSSNLEEVGSLFVYQRSGGDQYPRIILSGWTFGRELTITDPVGNVYRYLTGLPNQGGTTNTSFIAHLPSLSTYVLEYPSETEITRKFINVTPGRSFIIPYFDQFNDLESAFTKGIFEAPPSTSIEISFISPSSWIIASNQPSFLTSFQGNVGIGVALPSNLFEVEGNAAFAGNVGIGTKSTEARLSVFVNGADNAYAAIVEQTNPLANGLSVVASSTTNTQKAMNVRTNNVDALIVQGDGVVSVPGTLTASNLTLTGNLNLTLATVIGVFPPGVIMIWIMETAPAGGWLVCYGQEESSTTYPGLSETLGNKFGTPSGPGLFRLPDLRGRFLLGHSPIGGIHPTLLGAPHFYENSNLVGNKGGDQLHTLTIPEMPAHDHNLFTLDNNRAGPGGFDDGSQGITGSQKFTALNGGNQPHNNMPPYMVMNYIIKT